MGATADKTKKAITAAVMRWYPTEILRVFYQRFHLSLLKKEPLGATEYSQFFAQQFQTRESFEQFMNQLADTVKTVFCDVVWERGIFFLDVVPGKTVSTYSKSSFYLLHVRNNPDFSVFFLDDDYYLRLPDCIRRVCKEYLDKPKGFFLSGFDSISRTDLSFVGEDNILAHLLTIHEFIALHGLERYDPEKKAPKWCVQGLHKVIKLKEFFTVKPYSSVRTALVLNFFVRAHRFFNISKGEHDVLKELFCEYIHGLIDFPESKLLLSHLKREAYRKNVDTEMCTPGRNGLLAILRAMPLGKWVSVEDVITYIHYRDIELPLYSLHFVNSCMYAQVEYRKQNLYHNTDSHRGRLYLKNVDLYNEAYVKPFLKAMLFFFAALELVDLAYDERFSFTMNQDIAFECPYNGLRFVRLNPLGAYVTGILGEYSSSNRRKISRIVLSKTDLIATVSNGNDMKYFFLRSIGKEISPCAFHIDYASFLKKCNFAQDVETKIATFTRLVENPLPENWRQFLAHVKNRINPFKSHQEMVVITLPHDEELFAILITDTYLRKTVLKVEDHRIAVPRHALKQVVSKLRKYGYLVDNLQEYAVR